MRREVNGLNVPPGQACGGDHPAQKQDMRAYLAIFQLELERDF
jgi:hypothetical protein